MILGAASAGEASAAPEAASPTTIRCAVESSFVELEEQTPFEVTVSWSLPAAAGQVRLNCELKGDGVDVFQARRPLVAGQGRQRLRFTALRRDESKHMVLACWLGTDWRDPLAPIHVTEPIAILSRDEAAKLRADRAAADEILQRVDWQADPRGNVGLLDAAWPGQNHAVIHALATRLRRTNCRLSLLDAQAFLNPFVVSPERFDVLIVTGGRELPVETARVLARFLEARGNLIAIGTPLYADPVCRVQDAWLKPTEIRARLAALRPTDVLHDFETGSPTGWTRSSNRMQGSATLACVDGGAEGSAKSLHAMIDDLTGWETFAAPPLADDAIGATQNVLCLWAKGAAQTKRLAVECVERDGSRWIATVPLTQDWAHHALVASDFAYWPDNPVGRRRGGGDDRLAFAAIARITVGLSFSHTGATGGRHAFWIDRLGFAHSPLADAVGRGPLDLTPTELLWPSYKCYRTTAVQRIRPHWMQALIEPPELPRPAELWCPHQRPHSTGFEKDRPWRMVTIAEAVGESDEFRGPALALTLQQKDGHKAQGWATLGVDDPAFLTAPGVVDAIAELAARMLRGVFLYEAGSEFYTVFEDEPIRLGARLVNIRRDASVDAEVRLRVLDGSREVVTRRSQAAVRGGEPPAVCETRWTSDRHAARDYQIVAELVCDDQVIDRLQHDLRVWRTKDRPEYVVARDGDFFLNGRKWYPFGVNHMPASGIGTEDYRFFEHYLSRRAYDPEIFERELGRIVSLGMNMVSAFIGYDYHADRNLLDYLDRCDRHGLKVNLSLRPGTPMDFEWDKIREMIVQNRLAASDTIFAYDLAWEPFIGRQHERARWDRQWNEWIERRYTTIDAAERAWGFAAPRTPEGQITNPADAQCGADGPWRKMVADYRRFIDELVDRHYGRARELVHSVDPHHLVSFRMTVAGDPTFNQAQNMPYDFRSLVRGVDMFEPEGYGRIGDWQRVRGGLFTVAYARAVDPSKPVMWAEYGTSTWDMNQMHTSPEALDFQGRFYDDFLKMVLRSGANGAVCWWYPGGFRANERSDFGILEPDGTDRPATAMLRRYAPQITRARDIPRPDVWIDFDPDDPAGVEGIYRQTATAFWRAIDAGQIPGLRRRDPPPSDTP